jgi:hypothetical protein
MRFKEFMEMQDDLAATTDQPTTGSMSTPSSYMPTMNNNSGKMNIDQIKAQASPTLRGFIGWYNSSRGKWADVMRASGTRQVQDALKTIEQGMMARNGVPMKVGSLGDLLQKAVTAVVPNHGTQAMPQLPMSARTRGAVTPNNGANVTAQGSGMVASTNYGDNNTTRLFMTKFGNHEERIGRLEKTISSGQTPSV